MSRSPTSSTPPTCGPARATPSPPLPASTTACGRRSPKARPILSSGANCASARPCGARAPPLAVRQRHAGRHAQHPQRLRRLDRLELSLHHHRPVQSGAQIRSRNRHVRGQYELLSGQRPFHPGVLLLLDRPRVGRRSGDYDSDRGNRRGDLSLAPSGRPRSMPGSKTT